MKFEDYYLSEYDYFDGEYFITFNIIDIDTNKNLIRVAISNRGKISVVQYDLLTDYESNLFFYYGPAREKIKINEFTNI